MFKKLSLYTVLLGMLLFSGLAYAQFSDLVTDNPSITFSMAGQNTTQTTALTGVLPVKKMNGWAGVYVSRQIVENEVVDEVYAGHVQGGFRIGDVGIEGFTELERNRLQDFDRIRIGYFARPGVYEVAQGRVSGGFGNYSENAEVLEEVGEKEALVGWLAFLSGHWEVRGLDIGVTVRYLPELDFDTQTVETVSSVAYELSNDFSLGLVLGVDIDRETQLHNQYLIALTWTPED